MARIHNAQLTKEVIEGAKIQTSHDAVPQQLAKSVVPTMETNPKLLRIINYHKSASRVTTGTESLATTSATKDTYITNIHFSFVKDATQDGATGHQSVQGTINGLVRDLISTAMLVTTAQNETCVINFCTPVKLDRNTAISMWAPAYTTGLMCRSCNIFGYEVED